MNTTPKGKIGRLPRELQEQVNRRLDGGETGAAVAVWLNSLPEVQKVLAAEFDGRPISEQNVSQWRQRGYQAWLRWRQALEAAQEGADLPAACERPMADELAGWAGVRYLMAVRELVDQQAAGEGRLKVLREFCRDVVALRRGEHASERLKMEWDRREIQDLKDENQTAQELKTLECSQPSSQ